MIKCSLDHKHQCRERLRKKILSKLSEEEKFYVDLFCSFPVCLIIRLSVESYEGKLLVEMKRLLCCCCRKLFVPKHSEQQKNSFISPGDILFFSSFHSFHPIIPKQPTEYSEFLFVDRLYGSL